MSLQTPSIEEIRDNLLAQLEAKLNQTLSLLPKAFLRVLASALAGVFILVYKYAGFMFLQLFVRYASTQETTIGSRTLIPVVEWGKLFGAGEPQAATNAQHVIEVSVETQTGALAAGSQLVSSASQVTYTTLIAVPLDAATVEVQIIAASDSAGGTGAGVVGNLEIGAKLTFVGPVANVAREAEVLSTVVQGADAEDWEVYRDRSIDLMQTPPQGGAYADYRIWARKVSGIVKAYVYTGFPGQVDTYVEATPASSGSPDGIPTGAQLQQVLDSIHYNLTGLAERRPANALPNALAITRASFDVRVVGLDVPDPVAVQAALLEAVTEYFLVAEPYIPGLSVPPRLDRVTQSAVGGIVADIVSAAGGVFTTATLLKDSVETAIYSLAEGEKAKLDQLVYL